MGQPLWFLGYPFEGMGSHFTDGTDAPFIKRGTMSAVNGDNPDAPLVYIDGFNNPGFSGGPVIYWNISARKYCLLAVVQGYREDTAKTLVNGQQVDTRWLVNSGHPVGIRN